ncbi:MurR/RpiR family transcriptional regulator [Pseudonocardia sichuanensis]
MPDTLSARLESRAERLPPAELAVARYMAAHLDFVAARSALEIAEAVGTSDATVVRTARSLGYTGLRELKRDAVAVLARREDPAAVLSDRLGRADDPQHRAQRVFRDSARVVGALDESIRLDVWEAAVTAALESDRVVCYGIGPAGAVAEFCANSLRRVGLAAVASATTGLSLADELLGLRGGDLLVVFAPLRLFREISVVLDRAREVGARSLAVTEALAQPLRERADLVLETPPSTTATASESIAAFAVAHALTIDIAARTRESSVATMSRLNELRHRVSGDDPER